LTAFIASFVLSGVVSCAPSGLTAPATAISRTSVSVVAVIPCSLSTCGFVFSRELLEREIFRLRSSLRGCIDATGASSAPAFTALAAAIVPFALVGAKATVAASVGTSGFAIDFTVFPTGSDASLKTEPPSAFFGPHIIWPNGSVARRQGTPKDPPDDALFPTFNFSGGTADDVAVAPRCAACIRLALDS
jgi:hypothetical protein